MNRLAELISQTGRQHAARTAIICGSERLTFSEVEVLSNRLASALVGDLDLRKGERVASLLPNCPAYVASDFALIKAGLVRVPLNPRLAPPEIEFIINDSGASAVIFDGAYRSVMEDIRGRLPQVRHFIATGDGVPVWAQGFDDLAAQGKVQPFAVETAESDPYMLSYTSGTTGRPKGALISVRSRWVTLFHLYANENFISSNDVMLHVASLAHGSGTKVLPNYIKGAVNVFLPRFTMAAFCEAVQEHRATTTWLVPTLIAMWLDFPQRNQYDLSSLRTVVYTGAPMPTERLKKALRAFGPIFVQVYGLCEVPQPALVLPKEDHVLGGTEAQMRRLASAGRPAVGARVRVVTEDDRDVSPGEIGEIIVAGDHIMVGYWNQPQATSEVLKGGWFYTGDLAQVDEEGYVFIVDRKKDMIISGGYNIYPREVEEVLYQHPAIQECAVFGTPDDLWGESVRAAVVLREGSRATETDIIEHCRQHLADYKKPKNVDILSALPKNPTGKILKKELREPYWAGRQRRVN